jgi:hypothetical protein
VAVFLSDACGLAVKDASVEGKDINKIKKEIAWVEEYVTAR